jgi:hypothetical protein
MSMIAAAKVAPRSAPAPKTAPRPPLKRFKPKDASGEAA